MPLRRRFVTILVFLAIAAGCFDVPAMAAESPGDRMLSEYFRQETARVNQQTFANVSSLADWTRERETYREQLREMLGLSPLPERTDLKVTITGRQDHAGFYVENLHYQSMPGLYVTGNLYVPKNLSGKVPAILYVCGHAGVKEGGVSYGNKTHYQHHGAWFARHGYVCLTIDTIHRGELEGIHHGTYSKGMWWWNSRGYTPAGVEAWNSIRALDYLQSRPEVDGERLGMTGRSGGGAYTWWTAAIDERVKAAVPVAGTTDLHSYVVDGFVATNCDCIFMVNTHRWDYAKVAALVAPRALLIGNSDKDIYFGFDGVVRLHSEVAPIYRLHGAADKLGLLITEGPHKDTQELQVPAFRWFDRFLKGESPLIRVAAEKFFTPQQLKVFSMLPEDERTTSIHETFVPAAAPRIPANKAEWERLKQEWLPALREKSFAGWPEADARESLALTRISRETRENVTISHWEFRSQGPFRLPLFILSRGDLRDARRIRLHVLDEQGWASLLAALGDGWRSRLNLHPATVASSAATVADHQALLSQVERGDLAVAYLAPRGVGPNAWSGDERQHIQIRRRFMLLGQTLDGMRVWDIRRAVEALRQPGLLGSGNVELKMAGERNQAVNALYASLFSDGLASLELIEPPASHQAGPDYLNVLRILDIPQAVAMAVERHPIKLTRSNVNDWAWAAETARRLGWAGDRLQ